MRISASLRFYTHTKSFGHAEGQPCAEELNIFHISDDLPRFSLGLGRVFGTLRAMMELRAQIIIVVCDKFDLDTLTAIVMVPCAAAALPYPPKRPVPDDCGLSIVSSATGPRRPCNRSLEECVNNTCGAEISVLAFPNLETMDNVARFCPCFKVEMGLASLKLLER